MEIYMKGMKIVQIFKHLPFKNNAMSWNSDNSLVIRKILSLVFKEAPENKGFNT